ncbi:hypothetical protein [Mycoplasma sp. Ms02]|uniref:hypothetical protein n=1 Tax=Mycoplasma sp. Ms02 TaxID=353851 RepID=UPI001C8AF1FF|nr:hypothetical protein [Mycoplasma sp. Ms02]QZE12479.1 hypothetical protein K4L35_00600 [Mycoplasma sp. Ms02]
MNNNFSRTLISESLAKFLKTKSELITEKKLFLLLRYKAEPLIKAKIKQFLELSYSYKNDFDLILNTILCELFEEVLKNSEKNLDWNHFCTGKVIWKCKSLRNKYKNKQNQFEVNCIKNFEMDKNFAKSNYKNESWQNQLKTDFINSLTKNEKDFIMMSKNNSEKLSFYSKYKVNQIKKSIQDKFIQCF